MMPHPPPAVSHRRTLRLRLAGTILCGATSLAAPCHAGINTAVLTGYGLSFFDDDFMRFLGTTAHGKEVPIGVTVLAPLTAHISAGVELRVSLLPFRWDYRLSDEPVGEATVSQNVVSALVRYDFGRGPTLPYLRAGLGLYAGAAGLQGDTTLYPDESLSFRRSLGMSAAAGVQGRIGPDKFWFGEAVFHAVRRTLNVEGYKSWRAHNCGAQIGVGRRF
ncbi:MAG: porin family protein [Candidatus Eisenbacteria bacterium]|jgi:hypothetical protein|nr:porin family protein [Candidatus Eisenbacteria bacterium]